MLVSLNVTKNSEKKRQFNSENAPKVDEHYNCINHGSGIWVSGCVVSMAIRDFLITTRNASNSIQYCKTVNLHLYGNKAVKVAEE